MAETEIKSSQKDKKRRVKALFSYTPVNIDELQLKVNDILEVIEETEEGWWKGILNGAEGMFPSNFVIELDKLPEDLNNHSLNELSPTKILTKAKNVDINEPNLKQDITHSPSSKRDIKSVNLSSNSDDMVDSPKLESLDKKGSLNKKNVDTTAPRLPPKPVREQARVIYPYTALNEDELSLKEGDIITVISKEVEDKGWWKGELNNRTGVFPDNFVQLIKVEEQKKPERPDKPSSALTSRASLKSSSSDKGVSEISPKTDKKVLKTPPTKPPPPEIHKKEHERPTPPFPSKKPQVPHPMKKPSRSSLGSKFSGFSPPATLNSAKPPPVPESPAPLPPPVTSTPETKPDMTKIVEKFNDKEDKRDTMKKENQDLGFEGLESSGKKLVHLTANRAKVPNRRPPSHVFLRECEKENGVDPRRLSEPLLSEMRSILQLGETESHKAIVAVTNEVKAKVPPSRPLPPSIKGNKPAIQGSVVLTKTISSEECIVKAPEPIKKTVLPDTSNISGPEILQPKKLDLPLSDFKFQSFDKEVQELKESFKVLKGTTVSRSEFNELAKQVKEMKESLEECNNTCKKTINELKSELELEKKMRQALEIELQQMKEHQTT